MSEIVAIVMVPEQSKGRCTGCEMFFNEDRQDAVFRSIDGATTFGCEEAHEACMTTKKIAQAKPMADLTPEDVVLFVGVRNE